MRHLVTLVLLGGLGAGMAQPARASDLYLGLARTQFSESYLAQDLESRVNALDQFTVAWQSPVGGANRLLFQLTRESYQLDDADFPGTRHRRQQTGLTVGARRDLGMPLGTLGLGVGYSLELLQVESSATLPGDEPGFLFLPWQAYHGPAMLADFRVPLFGPLGVRLGAEWHPVVFAQLSDAGLVMPGYMTRVKVDPRVTLWGDRVSVGYVYQRILGSGYDRSAAGFLASVSLLGI